MRTPTHVVGGLLICLGLCGSLMACSSFSPQEPPLPDSTFIEVLTELHLARVRVNLYEDTTVVALRDSILSHYGVPSQQFEEALRYYSERPSAYAPIHGAVQDSLEEGRKRLMR